MTYNWVNFRNTAGYVTDAGGDTYSLGETLTDNITNARLINGVYQFGWDALNSASENRNASQNPHWAGRITSTGAREFLIDNLVPNRPYNFRMCQGRYNAGIALQLSWKCYQANDTTVAHAGYSNTNVPDGGCMGMDGTTYATFADWLAAGGGAVVQITPTGTQLRFAKGSTSGGMSITALGIEDSTTSGGGGGGVTDDLLLLGVG